MGKCKGCSKAAREIGLIFDGLCEECFLTKEYKKYKKTKNRSKEGK